MKRVAVYHNQVNGTLYIALYDCELYVGSVKVIEKGAGERDVVNFLESVYHSPLIVGVSKWYGFAPVGRFHVVFVPPLFNPARYLYLHYKSSRAPLGGYKLRWYDWWRCIVRSGGDEWKVNLRNLTCTCRANGIVFSEHELCEHLMAAFGALSDTAIAMRLRAIADEYEWRVPHTNQCAPVVASISVDIHTEVVGTSLDAQVHSDGVVDMYVRVGGTNKVARYANIDEFIDWLRSVLVKSVG